MRHTDAETVLENIRGRRTIPYLRLRTDPLEEGHLRAILEAANWAPSHRHTEPWRFAIFTGEGRGKLSTLLTETYREWAGEEALQRKIDKTIDRCHHVPVVLAILMRPKGVNPLFEEILAMGGAVQNMHLAAQALGIGCAWSTPGYIDHPKIRDFFALSGDDRCFGFYYIGYIDGEIPTSKRGDLEEKLTWYP